MIDKRKFDNLLSDCSLKGTIMRFPRRQFLHLAAGAAVLSNFSRDAEAQGYPTRPITLIVPFAAGGIYSAVGRAVAERMKDSLGQPIIIENVGGADGNIGVGRAAHARPDGHTIVLGSMSTHVLNGAFYSLQYDVLNDFAPIAAVATTPFVLVAKKSMPGRDLNELIVWMKANPNKASAAVPTGSVHLVTAFFQKETGTRFTHVPYRGGAQLAVDLVAGHIDLSFRGLDLLPLVRAGSLKAYAVTSDTRTALAPDIPTFGEMGLPALSFSTWFGLFAPKGTPSDIISKLNAAVIEAPADPVVRSQLVDLGLDIFQRDRQTPEVLGALVGADAGKWWPVIKELGMKAE